MIPKILFLEESYHNPDSKNPRVRYQKHQPLLDTTTLTPPSNFNTTNLIALSTSRSPASQLALLTPTTNNNVPIININIKIDPQIYHFSTIMELDHEQRGTLPNEETKQGLLGTPGTPGCWIPQYDSEPWEPKWDTMPFEESTHGHKTWQLPRASSALEDYLNPSPPNKANPDSQDPGEKTGSGNGRDASVNQEANVVGEVGRGHVNENLLEITET
ncbi:hypothetical protein SBOR_6160 [Sclerotinia borealis F-4128]|uniref:Uncharacterized protein n=1 Tax=Sclerotinia borealis (strain F-4128) TaxID=1432307 RepID=W9CCA9_SCLBF|nr:hypothetical protein SBOR_6160 [Sclerotinia borealis F-4128]